MIAISKKYVNISINVFNQVNRWVFGRISLGFYRYLRRPRVSLCLPSAFSVGMPRLIVNISYRGYTE